MATSEDMRRFENEEAQRGFLAAYEWMLKIQNQLLFEKLSVNINTQYTPRNDDGDISAFTVEITVFGAGNERVSARWATFNEENEFSLAKKAVEEFVKKRATLNAWGCRWSPVDHCPKTDNSWRCATIGLHEIWVDEVEGKKFLNANGTWYECSI